jgi:hypothetical protein
MRNTRCQGYPIKVEETHLVLKHEKSPISDANISGRKECVSFATFSQLPPR